MVDKTILCRQYAHVLIGQNIKEFLKYAASFSKKPSAESLHRARVTLRRIHNLLTIFHDVVSHQEVKAWDRAIAAAGQALGQGRDLDVWIYLLKRHISQYSSLHKATSRKIVLILEKERQKKQTHVEDIFADLKRKKIFQDANHVFGCDEQYPVKDQVLYGMAKRKITKRLKRFLAFRPFVNHPEQGKQLHRMRIAGKKLRYTLESFEHLYGVQAKYFYHTVYAMQIALGEMHDAEMLTIALHDIEKGTPDAKTKETLVYLCGFFTKLRQASYQKFLKLWKKNNQQKFWQKLRKFIKSSI